ncbi:uncharacterized protein [Watersipora subatra]|uniref:uncharacterized protein n=1 Tax=Watersipora subatra TaxID=2589382 RepID=UPI00355C27E4
MQAMADTENSLMAHCVFCGSKDQQLVDPRVLPCCHVSCKKCLDSQPEIQKEVWCKDCEKTFDVAIDELPTYDSTKVQHECEACRKKSEKILAVVYCRTCNKKFCGDHQKWHNELHDEHTTVPIRQYAEQAERLETRYCTEHKTESYTLGCENCLTVFCTSCISPKNTCKKGKAHVLVNLPELGSQLTSKVDKLVVAMVTQEDELSTLFKETSKVCSEMEKETQNMLKQLHNTRDAQIQAIKEKYEELERKLLESRRRTQEEVKEFMKDKIGTMLTTVSNKRADLEARIKNNHQANTIRQYKDIQKQADQLLKASFPSLILQNVQKLSFQDERRDLEVEAVTADIISYRFKYIPSASCPLNSCTLVKSHDTGSFCHAVCHYQNKTYVGTQKSTIDVIDSSYKQTTIVRLDGWHWAYGIEVHDDRLYALVTNFDKPCTINVYDLTGKLIKQWYRDDRLDSVRLTVVLDKVVVADFEKWKLTVYSLDGNVEKIIACSMLSRNTSICKVGSESVVVTSKKKSLVKRISISTGLTEWECQQVAYPEALSLCGEDLVCVFGNKELAFLSSQSGQLVARLTVPMIDTSGNSVDIDINGNTLIVSSCKGKESKLNYYSLNI